MGSWPKSSPRYSEFVRKVKRCGHWEFTGFSHGESDVVLRHRSGATISYPSHDGGNDINAPRNFATEAGRICGCKFIEHRNRRRSRKVDRASRFIDSRPSEHTPEIRERLDDLRARYIQLIEEAARERCTAPLREALAIEKKLREACQPPPVGTLWLSERLTAATRSVS